MERERIPCVYILARRYHGTLYTGVTSNLVGRVIQLNPTWDDLAVGLGLPLPK